MDKNKNLIITMGYYIALIDMCDIVLFDFDFVFILLIAEDGTEESL